MPWQAAIAGPAVAQATTSTAVAALSATKQTAEATRTSKMAEVQPAGAANARPQSATSKRTGQLDGTATSCTTAPAAPNVALSSSVARWALRLGSDSMEAESPVSIFDPFDQSKKTCGFEDANDQRDCQQQTIDVFNSLIIMNNMWARSFFPRADRNFFCSAKGIL
jgi:hypothetical protein